MSFATEVVSLCLISSGSRILSTFVGVECLEKYNCIEVVGGKIEEEHPRGGSKGDGSG